MEITNAENFKEFQNLETQKIENKNEELEVNLCDSLISHLAVENVFNSNLIDDIAYVDYTENSQGMTCLQELEGLPPFIDDLYAYLFIHPNEVQGKGKGKHLNLIQGENQTASDIVSFFRTITNETFKCFCPQKIAFSVDIREN